MQQAYDCQQYCMNSAGYPPLVDWVSRHVRALHAPPAPVAHLVTCGNTNAIDLVLRCLLNPGDAVLCEEFTYSATLQAMKPLGVRMLGIPSDEEGPRPDALRALLQGAREGIAAATCCNLHPLLTCALICTSFPQRALRRGCRRRSCCTASR